jgi:4-hydroxy-tetrahydrodipicolinate synthase
MFASPIDVPTIKRLAEECPRIVGIKDSSGDLPFMMRMIQSVRPLRPDFSFITGWDAALMPMLLIGCDGGTNATSGIVPEVTRKLYDLTLAGEIAAARKLQYQLLELFDAMIYTTDFPEGVRAAMRLRGFDTGAGRQPLAGSQQIELGAVSRSLQCLLAEHGYSSEPVGGCLPRMRAEQVRHDDGSGMESIDVDQVGAIVQGVLEELQRRGMG